MTDEQLETLISDIEVAQYFANVLVDLQDYIDQIELTATMVSHYGHHHKDKNDLQVRMMGNIAAMGSKLLKEAEAKISNSLHGAHCTAREIKLQKMREKDDLETCYKLAE